MEEDLNKKWNIHNLIQEAVKNTHTSSAPETIARLKLLEKAQERFMDKLEGMEKKLDKLAIDIALLPEKIFEKADKKYASKIIERAVYAIIGAVCLTVVYAIIELVIKR